MYLLVVAEVDTCRHDLGTTRALERSRQRTNRKIRSQARGNGIISVIEHRDSDKTNINLPILRETGKMLGASGGRMCSAVVPERQ